MKEIDSWKQNFSLKKTFSLARRFNENKTYENPQYLQSTVTQQVPFLNCHI
jgi:hypothetical protein